MNPQTMVSHTTTTNDDEEHQQEFNPLHLPESEEPVMQEEWTSKKQQQELEKLKKEQKLEFEKFKEHQESETLQEDIFSIMMVSKICSIGWTLGLVTSLFQLFLVAMILWGYVAVSYGNPPFDAPIHVDTNVRVGQFIAILLSLLTQDDILSAINSLIHFRRNNISSKTNLPCWYELLDCEDDDDNLIGKRPGPHDNWILWFNHVVVPNLLKVFQGSSVLVTSFIIIVQSDDLIDLLKDYTALYFVSEIDNIIFNVCTKGYFGTKLKQIADDAMEVKIVESPTEDTFRCFSRSNSMKLVILCIFSLGMLGGLGYFVQGQRSIRFVRMKYPSCTNYTVCELYGIGDDNCNGKLNNEECGYDGGDCTSFNLQYSNCRVDNVSFVGDGFCNGGVYDTVGCSNDGGDCDECPPIPRLNIEERWKSTLAIKSVDLNNDNRADIIMGTEGQVMILFNKGYDAGVFDNETPVFVIRIDKRALVVDVGDFDNDGNVDIIVGSAEEYHDCDATLYILWNNGDETFDLDETPYTPGVVANHEPTFRTINCVSFAVDDIDRDGNVDIVVGNSFGTNSINILWNNGKRQFSEANFMQHNRSTTALAVVDLNSDTFPDIVIGNFNGPNQVAMNNRYRGFNLTDMPSIDETYRTSALAIALLPNLPYEGEFWSVVVGRTNAPNYGLRLKETEYYNIDWPYKADVVLELPGGNSNTRSIEIADMNGDRLPDLIIGNDFDFAFVIEDDTGTMIFKDQKPAPNQVILHDGSSFLLDCKQPFQTIIDLPCSSSMGTDDIIIADFNDDGHMDIVIHNLQGQKDQILINFGDGITYKPPMNDTENLWLPNPTPL